MAEVKVYRPGDPEFDAIAKQIRPIERVRSGTSHQTTYIDAEPESVRGLRKESVNKLR